jgi:hypothetical protein
MIAHRYKHRTDEIVGLRIEKNVTRLLGSNDTHHFDGAIWRQFPEAGDQFPQSINSCSLRLGYFEPCMPSRLKSCRWQICE